MTAQAGPLPRRLAAVDLGSLLLLVYGLDLVCEPGHYDRSLSDTFSHTSRRHARLHSGAVCRRAGGARRGTRAVSGEEGEGPSDQGQSQHRAPQLRKPRP